MQVIILKKTKQNKKWLNPSSEPIEIDDKIAKSLIEKGIAKDSKVKETVIVKDEALSLEIEKLKEEKENQVIEIDKLKELLKVSIGLSKDKVPEGAESYIEVDLTK